MQAFVIYCFFVLLLTYLGGERSLLIMLHGRPPKVPIFPINIFKREIDVSDPFTFLFLKRGILRAFPYIFFLHSALSFVPEYVQVKPLLAAATLITKYCGKYNEGDFRANSGYLYITVIYNLSITTALYCLAMFWTCVSDDLKPYRPVPKFLCVKGILFFSFWQSVVISILVAADVVTKLGPYTDPEHVSTGWNNVFICLEMPMFAFAHMFAFSYKDYIDNRHTFVARMPFYYAFRDAFGLKDVIEDSKATLRGEGMDYREFEPAEGFMHQGAGREARMRAGLRYSQGGQKKYWLPKADPSTVPIEGRGERLLNKAISKVAGEDQTESVHAPLLSRQAQSVVHLAPDMMEDRDDEPSFWGDPEVEDGYDLPFGDVDEMDEELFEHSKRYLFGDYNYPCIDVSTDAARKAMWDEEERVLNDERGAWFSPIRGAKGTEAILKREGPAWQGYGAVGTSQPPRPTTSKSLDEVREVEGARVIDIEQERATREAETADKQKGGVALRWTKSRGHTNKASSSSSPASSSSSRPSPNVRSPPPIHRTDSSSSAGSSSNKRLRKTSSVGGSRPPERSSPLPPDAVDLVVEDPSAADDELLERRTGDPTARTSGLKKIYRRGFEAEANDGEGKVRGEVEVEEPSGRQDPRRRVEAGEEIAEIVEREGVEVGERESGESVGSPWVAQSPDSRTLEGVVARAGTPPLHARVDAFGFGDIPEDNHDHNPWA